jgi:hypothetical protein
MTTLVWDFESPFGPPASMALARRSMICCGVALDRTGPAVVSTRERKVWLRM